MNEKLLKVIELKKSYGKKMVLTDISFELSAGEILVLVGENGAGKSTLISILATIIKPDAGEVLLNGKSIIKTPSFAKGHIAYLPQETTLYNNLSVQDNLHFWATIGGMSRQEQKDKVPQIISEFRLSEYEKHKVGKLSVGLRRRVNIATALLNETALLLMDEPTAGLDAESSKEIIEIVKRLREKGMSIIYVTHVAEEIEALAARVLQI